jgi:hypothetical protein
MATPKAVKTVITITVYSRDSFVDEQSEEVEGFPVLDMVIYEMTYGGAVGSYEMTSSEVEGEALRDSLIDIGNDGTFFDEEG